MIPSTSPAPAPFDSERLLRQASSDVEPRAGAQARVQRMVRSRMRGPALLMRVRESLIPERTALARLWSSILTSIDPLTHLSLWEKIQAALRPADDLRDVLWSRLSLRLEPAYVRVFVSRPVKWVAAFALVLVVVRASPLLFLAPASIAESPVLVFSTRGNAEVLLGSLWQPVPGEITLRTPTRLQTQDGAMTIVDHDDAVFRLAPHTRVSFLDLSDRPADTQQESTLVLEEGQLWVLGLVPKHLRGITVVTAQGRVVVHEGSVSVRQEDGQSAVEVFDRSAVVFRHGKQLPLVAGESTALIGEGDLAATKVDSTQFQGAWAFANLSRDAAHQREIAQLQQERRAASAGILPGATLYGVKRLAEQVDVMLSFSADERARKLVTQANTRLNEAAALLQSGASAGSAHAAENALQEYKDTLLQVASGSGGSAVVRSLLQKEVVEGAPATVSAALPGDEAYALKQAVDDTIAALPSDTVDSKPDLESAALLDQLTVAKRQAEQGDTALAQEKLTALTDSLATLQNAGAFSLVPADVRQEAQAMADHVVAVIQGPAQGIELSLGAPQKPFIEPQHPARSVIMRPLTIQQIAAKVQEIRGRIFVFGTKKARYDALEDQLSLLVHSSDRGRVLRELSKVLPRDGLAQRAIREIQTLSRQVTQEVTASGGVAQP